MRFHQRLSVRLIIWVNLVLAGLFIVGAVLVIRAQERMAIDKMLQTANWFSDTVIRSTRFSMLRDQRDNLHKTIEALGQQDGVEAVRVFNKSGEIMFSSRREDIGTMVDMQAEACYACHYKDRPLERLAMTQRSRIYKIEDSSPHRILGIINPIYTEKPCYTDPCHVHSPDQTVLGVLDVGLSLAAVDREVNSTTNRLILSAILFFGLISLVLTFFTLHFVNRPLSSLLEATQRIAQGDYERPVSLVTRDEIGLVAGSLDLMRVHIKKQTEDLEESRRRFQTLFEQVPCYVSVQDADLRLVAFNKMFERDFGNNIGEHCYKAYKGRDSICDNCAVVSTFRDGLVHSAEETVTGLDGSCIYFLNMSAPIKDKNGQVTQVLEMSTDVTAVHKLREELKKSEEKYRLFFNNDPNPIFVFSHDSFLILDANDRAYAQFGYPGGDLTGTSFLDLIGPEDRERVQTQLSQSKRLIPRVHQMKKTGDTLIVNVRAAYSDYLGDPAVIATTADIGEYLKTEQQLVQAAKMATLGEMSAGVAHELNQPLSVIGTCGSILLQRLGNGNPLDPALIKEVAEEVKSQVNRASSIINHLREFGRKAEVNRDRVSLNEPIKGVFRLLGQQMRVHNIIVETTLDENLPLIWGDFNRLEQVFLNLVINARDAIEERAGQEKGMFRGWIRIFTYTEGEMVTATVSDNGSGIPQAKLDHIFEPFYTTKQVGKGTGLGLSITYGIVRDYEGTIEAASVVGKGTTFRVSFPPAGEER